MRLSIKIFTGESPEKYTQNLKLRAGQITTVSDCPKENVDAATVFGDAVRVGHTFKMCVRKGGGPVDFRRTMPPPNSGGGCSFLFASVFFRK